MPADRIIAISIFSISGIFLLGAAIYTLRKGNRIARSIGLTFMLIIACWVLVYALELTSNHEASIVFWSKIKWFFLVSLSPTWLILILTFSGFSDWVTSRRIALLFIIPAITMVLIFTNDAHHLIWTGYDLVPAGSFITLVKHNAAAYFAYILYAYVLLIIATAVLFRSIIRSRQLFKRQGILLIVASLVPAIAGLLDTFNFSAFDLLPFSYSISVPMLALALPRLQIMKIVPIARHTIVQHIAASVIVIDSRDQIVDLNPAAQALFSIPPEEFIGQPAALFWNMYPALEAAQPQQDGSQEIVLTIANQERFFEVLVTSLTNKTGEYLGKFLVLHDISQRKLGEQQVTTALREREVLLKEIHHRVKNNLQVIASLLSIQIEKSSDPQTIAPLQDSKDRVYSMALIHEHLYQSPTLSEVNMQEYFENLTGQLADTNQGSTDTYIAIDVTADAIFLDIDRSIACGLIVTELFSNAFKHAFPDQQTGKIGVSLRLLGDEQYCLEVSDNGVGLPADFDLDQANSLGMKLVKTLTGQLEAKLEFDVAHGTIIRIRF